MWHNDLQLLQEKHIERKIDDGSSVGLQELIGLYILAP